MAAIACLQDSIEPFDKRELELTILMPCLNEALLAGMGAARGRYVIMGDADDSYGFSRLDAFIESLRCGNTMVIGIDVRPADDNRA